ncbi:phosphotransferase [Microlunatus speluncae]|uniref:phosphotransferase n=1 Tax=Microlunatus speluncae TaxID=2594267 RepID=UPI001266510E|nr:phosphotransferase [Microlunatus speluncae]
MVRPSPIPTAATARRPVWSELPAPVRREIERLAGGTVVRAESQGGGYTPGFASRLLLADGSRVFVKGASSEYPWMIEAYQAEVDKLRLLPAAVPAPRAIFDHRFTSSIPEPAAGQTPPVAEWLITGFADVAGRPPIRPWREDEAKAVLDRVAAMSRVLTPPPSGADWIGFDDEFAANAADWSAAVERRLVPDSLVGTGPALAREFLAHCAKTTLVHCDLRDDNVIIGSEVWVCDWNYPVLGPTWTDAMSLLISMHGDGLDADQLLAATGLAPESERSLINGFLATLLGYFAIAGHRPEVDNSPYLRTLQRWYADAAADWLLRRLDRM